MEKLNKTFNASGLDLAAPGVEQFKLGYAEGFNQGFQAGVLHSQKLAFLAGFFLVVYAVSDRLRDGPLDDKEILGQTFADVLEMAGWNGAVITVLVLAVLGVTGFFKTQGVM